MSTDTYVLRPPPRKTATVRGRAISPPSPQKPSSLTQSFFARGEEQEATGYENLAPDDPILTPPVQEFESFDKIPHRRGAWLGVAVLTLLLGGIGVLTWPGFHLLSDPGSSVETASRAMVQATPPAQSMPAPATSSPAAQPAPLSVAPATEPEPVTQPAPVKEPAPIPRPAPVTEPRPVTQGAPVHHESAQPDRDLADEPVHARRHAPLRGYVWSPEKHTIVPAEPTVEDSLPREAPRPQSLDGTPAEEPQPPREPTKPAPFQPPPSSSPAPSGSAPIID